MEEGDPYVTDVTKWDILQGSAQKERVTRGEGEGVTKNSEEVVEGGLYVTDVIRWGQKGVGGFFLKIRPHSCV